jgi:hypothetical protein
VDSLDAECLVIRAVGSKIPPPDLWRHDRSGALSCAYENGEQTFTWPPEDVAAMARKWRESDSSKTSEQATLFAETHRRLVAMAKEAGLGPPDVMIHHLGRGELRGVWEDKEIVVEVVEIGGSASNQASAEK